MESNTRNVLACFICFILCIPITLRSASAEDVTILTSMFGGVYYQTGENLCDLIELKPDYGINCSVIATAGSVWNINEIAANNYTFATVQSDILDAAWNGEYDWQAAGPQNNLRVLFSVHNEFVTLIAGNDTGIATVADLVGKHVCMGSGGYARRHAEDALATAGVVPAQLTVCEDWPSDAVVKFQNNEIDAFFYSTAHPNDWIIDNVANGTRDANIIPITNTSDLISEKPYYAEATIPIHFYSTDIANSKILNTQNVNTFAVKAVFITHQNTAFDFAYAFTREPFDNFHQFRQLHDAYELLVKNDMLKAFSVDLHNAAVQYYKEVIFRDICDANDDGETGLEEAINALQIVSGLRPAE